MQVRTRSYYSILTLAILTLVIATGGAAPSHVVQGVASAEAMQESAASGTMAGQAGTILIDGAHDPEQIPDDVAVRLVLRSLAASDNWDGPVARVRRGKLGLSDADLMVLREELTDLRGVTNTIRQEAKAASASDDRARLGDAWQDHEMSAQSTYLRLMNRLSPDGQLNLQTYIRRAKRSIRKVAPQATAPAPVSLGQ